MEIYERSLQALLSFAPHGFTACFAHHKWRACFGFYDWKVNSVLNLVSGLVKVLGANSMYRSPVGKIV